MLDRCYATTSPFPTNSTYYDLFVGWVIHCVILYTFCVASEMLNSDDSYSGSVSSLFKFVCDMFFMFLLRCTRDGQIKVDVNGVSQKAYFSFEAFRFVQHKNMTVSTFYLHCVTRLCEVSTCQALLPVSIVIPCHPHPLPTSLINTNFTILNIQNRLFLRPQY